MKKGISPLIAAVLLIAMVMSVAMIASSFLPNLMTGITSSTSDDAEQLRSSISKNIDITQAEYSDINNKIEVTLQSEGDKVTGGFIATIYCDNGDIFQQEFPKDSLNAGEISTADITSDCDPDKIKVNSQSYSISASVDNIEFVDSEGTVVLTAGTILDPTGVDSNYTIMKDMSFNEVSVYDQTVRLGYTNVTTTTSTSYVNVSIYDHDFTNVGGVVANYTYNASAETTFADLDSTYTFEYYLNSTLEDTISGETNFTVPSSNITDGTILTVRKKE